MLKIKKIGEHKYFEFQTGVFPDAWYTILSFSLSTHSLHITVLGLSLESRWRTDHTGIRIEVMSPLGHLISAEIYDSRHWDAR